MASIKKITDQNGKTKFKVTVSLGRRPDGRQVLKSKTFHPDEKKSDRTNQRDLERFAFEFEKKCLSGEIEAERLTVEQFGHKWLHDYVCKELEKTTQVRYRNGLEKVVFPRIGHLKLSQIKPSTIQGLVNDMRQDGFDYGRGRKGEYSDESIRTIKTILSSMMSAAVEDGLIQSNPCSTRIRKHKKVSTKKQAKRSFTIDETIRFLKIIEDPIPVIVASRKSVRHGKEVDVSGYASKELIVSTKFQALFIVAIFSGTRREEILGLKWKDVDFDGMTISICRAVEYVPGEPIFVKTPKSEAGYRKIFLPQACIDKLARLKEEQQKEIENLGTYWVGSRDIEENWCFTQANGMVMHPATPRQKMQRIIRAYNRTVNAEDEKLPVITFHELRHTSASLLIAQGMEVTAVAKRLGHADASTTLRVYAHSFEERDRTASDMLEDMLIKKTMDSD